MSQEKVYQARKDQSLPWFETSQEQQESLVNECGWEGRVLFAQPTAPAMTVDTPEFMDAICTFYEQSSREEFDQVAYNAARVAVIANIDAHAAEVAAKAVSEKDEEILALHRKLAGETLRADQGWARYEEANRSRIALQMERASAPQQHAQAALSDSLPQPFYGAIALLETIASHGCQSAFDDGTATPNAKLCERFARELRKYAASQQPAAALALPNCGCQPGARCVPGCDAAAPAIQQEGAAVLAAELAAPTCKCSPMELCEICHSDLSSRYGIDAPAVQVQPRDWPKDLSHVSDSEAVAIIETDSVNDAFIAFADNINVGSSIRLVQKICAALASQASKGAETKREPMQPYLVRGLQRWLESSGWKYEGPSNAFDDLTRCLTKSDFFKHEHPNLDVAVDPACSAKLDDLGDDRGQGLDAYWKWGFRAGWKYGQAAIAAQAQPVADAASKG